MAEPILKTENLTKVFPIRKGGLLGKVAHLRAVTDVSLELRKGEVLGLVGESGCGKSTLGRLVLGLLEPTSGRIYFDGRDLSAEGKKPLRRLRSRMQMVFQDPNGSLNPSMTVGRSIMETLRFHGIGTQAERRERALAIMRTVGLQEAQFNRLPHQLSGGQNQRVGIARALVINPDLLVLDEPVSALDVSVQAQVLKLLEEVRSAFDLSFLFISHDLNVVHRISDRIVVLYLGRVMEVASANDLFSRPLHPYTRGLLSSRPVIDPKARSTSFVGLSGDLPSPLAHPPGCPFVTRCSFARDVCRREMPPLEDRGGEHQVACFALDDLENSVPAGSSDAEGQQSAGRSKECGTAAANPRSGAGALV